MSPENYAVLIVDDTHQNVQVLSQMLRDAGYKVFAAFNGEDALKLMFKRKPDLVLLDVMMPGMNGFEVCQKIKSDPEIAHLPVIFLSALNDIEAKIKAFEAGGVDYVTKPFQQQEVLARISLHLRLHDLELERERNIAELREKQLHLERLNKEKDDVLAIISHDMRNPLGGIIGVSNLLRTEAVTDPEEVEEMLMLIESSAERLLGLVNDLLDIAVIEANIVRLERSPVEITGLVHDIVHLHSPAAKNKGVNLVTNFPNEKIIVNLDASKIGQVVGNLLSNAIKFTPKEGTVSIGAKSVDEDTILIEVEDSGIGIPPEMMPRLFEKMGGHQRPGTDGEKGTGLGMPLVKRYVEVHNGTLDVSSKEGIGTRFVISLPA